LQTFKYTTGKITLLFKYTTGKITPLILYLNSSFK